MKIFYRILSAFVIIWLLPCFYACSEDHEPKMQHQVADLKQRNEKLEDLNRNLILQERKAIDEYIENSGFDFERTGTGLCYRIVNQGDGELIKTGDIVSMEYEMSLLNGNELYNSNTTGPKVFLVGRGGVESGLEEAVLKLHNGDEAEIIIPSRLAYGLTGDGDKIPSNATIVYKVKIIDNQINN